MRLRTALDNGQEALDVGEFTREFCFKLAMNLRAKYARLRVRLRKPIDLGYPVDSRNIVIV